MTTLIKGAFVYMGAGFSKLDVLITDGKINTLATSISTNGVDAVFFAQDKYLIPGFVDVHIHLREPGFSYKETIRTGTLAAAKGGYTGVCPMPNINPVPDSVENIGIELYLIKKDAVINTYPFASITKGRKGRGELVDFDALKELAVGFSDDGTGVQDEQDMRLAMEQCAKIGKVISAHCEVNDFLHGGYIHDGEYCKAHGHKGICSASEYEQIERDCKLAEETGVRYHVCHISTKESVDIIRKAKARGVNVTCETGPHYLTMCDKDLQEDGRFKMNPPLRSEEDKQALLQGILDGTIDVIATDHAPHSAEEKSKGLAGSAMGVVGLETSFAVLYTKLVKSGFITLEKLIELMSVNPRKIFDLPGGEIKEGEVADLALLDLDTKWSVDPDDFLSMGRATPFEGWQLQGKNIMTMCGGKVVYEAL
ncbi:dihydroorotase [Eubacterium coprostanoligenes]|uniref:dihydroorotase n=1 Tax=Eubacterium coprostanoligenes TaxID=290054 RepID=UPI0023531B80|nr:dihydroorotase [Eubacterium coprostanoligenes]MCI6253230.1 dihydroorotase [Eubacterium coprostanoligenes]MCI7265415.1 dihydroorotase [Eubacterium coprostanoligenes]MDY5400465.1 dihydroorotase [Eubacterium coprostanoligenes]